MSASPARRAPTVVAAFWMIMGGAMAACGASSSEERAGATPRPDSASLTELEAIFWDRLEGARERFTEADVRFMTDMIGHHAQAVEMAELAPDRAASASVRTLAARIINAQMDEIAIMERWLLDRGQPLPEGVGRTGQAGRFGRTGHTGRAEPPERAESREREAPAEREDHSGHPRHVAGMLTPEQMRELERADGAEFDRLFLSRMIEHHRGAVAMVRELFGTEGAAQDPEVFKLASDVQVDQTTEIARMERMLTEM